MNTTLIVRARIAAWFLVLLAIVHTTRAAALDCLLHTTPIDFGSYASGCPGERRVLLAGRPSPGVGCEYRGFLVLDVPASPAPFVTGELRVSVDSVTTPLESEKLELRPVTTSLVNLTNYSGSASGTFRDLADGNLLGSASFHPLAPVAGGGTAQSKVSIPFTDEGISLLNASRGRRLAIGVSVANIGSQPTSVRYVRLSTEASGLSLILHPEGATLPEAEILSLSGEPVLAGGGLVLSGVACGQSPLTLQWLKDDLEIPGATNPILTLNPVLPEHAGRYTLRVSNSLGVATSIPVDLPVVPVKIYSQLVGFSGSEGHYGHCFTVGVNTYYPVEYHWRKDGVETARTFYPSLCFTPLRFSDAGDYDVIIQNDLGSVTSAVVTVTVNPRPVTFEYFPTGTNRAALGMPFRFSSHASGTEPLSYQWLKDGLPLTGAVSNDLALTSALLSDAGSYQVVAFNPYSAVTTQVARLEVLPTVFYGPTDLEAPLGTRALLWSQPVGIPETEFQWYHNATPLPGENNAFLLRPAVQRSEEGAYFVVASNVFGVVTSQVARLTTYTVFPSVSIFPASVLPALLGGEVNLGVSTAGAPPPTLQWMRNGEPIPGETNSWFREEAIAADEAGEYTVKASNMLGSFISPSFRVDVVRQKPAFTLVPYNLRDKEGSLVILQSRVAAGPPATYQWRKEGKDLLGQTNQNLILPSLSAADTGHYEIVARNPDGEASHPFDLHMDPAGPLDRWDWSLPRPQGSRLKDVAYGNGRYVAVGKAGNIVTSQDGTNWTHTLVEFEGDFAAVVFGQDVFLALGAAHAPAGPPPAAGGGISTMTSGVLLRSADGVHWTPTPSPVLWPGHLAYGNGTFVLTGNGGGSSPTLAYSSPDGVNWTPRFAGVFAWGGPVTFEGGEFWVANSGELYRSSDGKNWELATRAVLGEPLGAVSYGKGRFVSIGDYAQIGQTSEDGRTWSPFSLTNIGIQSVTFGAGRFIAPLATVPGSILTSEDGRRWVARETGTRQELESMVFVNGQFWAVGEAGAILNSTNGIDWSVNRARSEIDYYGLAVLGNQVVAAGDNGTIQSSEDGQDWTVHPTPSGRNLHSLHNGGGLLVAGGRAGRIMTSPDAVRWTTRTSGTTNYVERLFWADRWVAACEGGDILNSPDGINWSAIRTDPISDHEGVAYGGGCWMVVGGFFRNGGSGNAVGTVFASIQGSTWTRVNFDPGVRLRDVAFGNGLFVVVGNDGALAVFSPTGNAQDPVRYETSYVLPAEGINGPRYVNLRRILFHNGRFIAVGNDGVLLSSSDPLRVESWTSHRSRTSQNLHDIIAAPDGAFYAVGNNGMILRSSLVEAAFTSIQVTSGGVRLEFRSSTPGVPVRLEQSLDMATWEVAVESALSPVDLPFSPSGAHYFRLVVP